MEMGSLDITEVVTDVAKVSMGWPLAKDFHGVVWTALTGGIKSILPGKIPDLDRIWGGWWWNQNHVATLPVVSSGSCGEGGVVCDFYIGLDRIKGVQIRV